MEENFSMEWNMESKIFSMKWKWNGRLPVWNMKKSSSIPYHALVGRLRSLWGTVVAPPNLGLYVNEPIYIYLLFVLS